MDYRIYYNLLGPSGSNELLGSYCNFGSNSGGSLVLWWYRSQSGEYYSELRVIGIGYCDGVGYG